MAKRGLRRLVLAGVLATAAVPGVSAADQDRYVVQFRPGRATAGRAALRAVGARIVLGLDAHEAVAARLPAAALARLRANPNVARVEPDPIRKPLALWSDVSLGGETLPYGIQMVQADLVSSPDAANRKVCIIDSGYSQQQEDLKDALSGEVTFEATDPGSGTWETDSCGHGSHVAGTVAAVSGNGIGVVGANPGVRLHIVKVFGDDDLPGANCAFTYSSNLVAALDKCVGAGANVVSMSLGGPFPNFIERLAFARAYREGVLPIAAAGNGGSTAMSYPAAYPSVLSVAALDADEVVASFSQKNADVELAAPGVSVLSTVPWVGQHTLSSGGTTWSGHRLQGAPDTTGVTGALVDGGQCLVRGNWAGKVVLCQRGDNLFSEKVLRVRRGGGVAAVIYNDVVTDPTCGAFVGSLGTAWPTIPAITLSCAQGAEALTHVASSAQVVSHITFPASSYEAWSGTSMATPHVSAVAALVWSCHPGLDAAAIRVALTSTARDLGDPGRDNAYGFGLVQARAALLSLGESTTCPDP